MRNKIIGVVILAVMIIASTVYFFASNTTPQIVLKGYIGSEKEGLMQDDKFKEILKDSYGVTFDYSKAGSIAMVEGDTSGVDFLFPSSQNAVEIFKNNQSNRLISSQIEFNSPIVLYSWDTVTDALIKEGIVKQDNNVSYIVDMPKLIDLATKGKKWSDIGLNDLYGNVNIISTDPTSSNSGNLFYGLLANILNGGQVVDETTIDSVMPALKSYYARQGFQPTGSEDLFSQYLSSGVGAYPLIACYESQIIEFSVQNPDKWEKVKNKIRILYPIPTVWSSHTYISLNENAVTGMRALQDEKIQNLAWEKHGFRSGNNSTIDDASSLSVSGIPENITKIISLPKPAIMDQIINELEGS